MKRQSKVFKSLIATVISLMLIISVMPTALAASSNDSTLTALTASQPLSGPFSPAVLAYTVSLPASVGTVELTPTAAAGATFTMDGSAVASKTYTVAYGCSATATIVVTAEDGIATTTYTVTITRAMPGTSKLLSPGISTGTLSPSFDPDKQVYRLTLAESTPSVTFRPVKAAPGARMYINGVLRTSLTVSLKTGQSKMVYIKIISPTKVQRIYNFRVVREKSTNANLSALKLSPSMPLTPSFSPDTASYTITVPEHKAGVTVHAKRADSNATVYINGVKTESRYISIYNATTKVVTIKVKSQAGNVKTFTITLQRPPRIQSFCASPKVNGIPTVQINTKPAKPIKFTYSLAKHAGIGATTTLNLYQADGVTLVANLLTRSDSAGTKTFTWDGMLGGVPVAAGTYKVQLNVTYTHDLITLNAAPRTITIAVK